MPAKLFRSPVNARVLALLIVASLGLAACGGGGSSTAQDTTSVVPGQSGSDGGSSDSGAGSDGNGTSGDDVVDTPDDNGTSGDDVTDAPTDDGNSGGNVGGGPGDDGTSGDDVVDTPDNDGSNQPVTKTVTVSWAPPATRSNGDPISLSELTGYQVRYGTQSGTYDNQVFAAGGNTTEQPVSDLVVGETYYFVVAAQDIEGLQSAPSEEVQVVLQ